MEFGKVGLWFSGGGFKGAFQARIMSVFREFGIKIDVGQGSSVGAMNIAKSFLGGVEDVWLKEIAVRGPHVIFVEGKFMAGVHVIRGNPAVYSDKGLIDLLDKYITDADLEKLVNCPTRIEVVVWNETLEKREVVSNHQFRDVSPAERSAFRQFIKASVSLPGFFPPVIINNQTYSDPFTWKLDSFKECDTVFMVDTNQAQVVSNTAQLSALRRMMKRNNSLADEHAELELEIFAEQNGFKFFPDPETDESLWVGIKRIARKLVGKPTKKLIVEINPKINIPTLMLDNFRPKVKKNDVSDIDIAMNHGYERAKEIIGKLLNV